MMSPDNDVNPFSEWDDWAKYGNELIKDSSKTMDEITKYIIALISSIIGIYTTLLTFFGLSEMANFKIATIIPLALIIISLGVCLLVFKPEMKNIPPDDPVTIRNSVIERSTTKYRYLSVGIIIFIIGILSIPIIIGIGSATPQENIQLIVLEDKQPLLISLPVSFEDDSLKTVPMKLVKQDDEKVVVILENGNTAEISREWFEVIIYSNS